MKMSAKNINATIEDIDKTLVGKGLSSTCSDKEKLCHLWNFYQQAESNMTAALGNIDILKKQFNEDRTEYEGYVDHIKLLSQGREELILEYEAENKELRQDIEDLAQQLASFRNPETEQALIDAGFSDIVGNKPREQIACLLIEIARLSDDLDAAKEQCFIQTPDGKYTAEQLYNMLQEDRQDLPFSSKGGRQLTASGDFNSMQSYSDLKDLLRNVDDLEITNDLLKQRLKAVSPKDYEEVMASRAHDSQPPNRASIQKRLQEAAEKVVWVPPKDMEEASKRLRDAEIRAAEAKVLEEELEERMGELERLRRHLHYGSSSGIADGDGSSASKRMDDRSDVNKTNEFLQQMLGSVEARLQQMKASTDEKDTVDDRKSLSDQLQNVQREFNQIKVELVRMMEKYNLQCRKYNEHRMHSKNKIFKAKEAFKTERQQLNEKVEHLENELVLIRVTMTKELEYKENMEKSHHNLLMEQRDLLSRLSEQEELSQEQMRLASSLKVRAQCLEDDNNTLNQRLEALTKQKYHLEKVMKELQLEKEKEDIYRLISTSAPDAKVTINSINTTGADEQELLETLLRSRSGAAASAADGGRSASKDFLSD